MNPRTESTIARPTGVGVATLLLSTSLVIGGIRAVFDLTQRVSGLSFVVAVLILLVFLGVFFFFVNRIAAGRNWARITLLVLLILQLPFAAIGSVAEVRANPMHGFISVIMLILQVLGVGLLFSKHSNLWFKRNK